MDRLTLVRSPPMKVTEMPESLEVAKSRPNAG